MSSTTAPKLTIGSFPYHPGFNPYQRLFTDALETAGLHVKRIGPRKFAPLQYASAQNVDLLHFDWHHSWYRSTTSFRSFIKRQIYRVGLRRLQQIPTVWTAHNLDPHRGSRKKIDRQMTQLLIDRCRGVMAMSHTAADLLRQEYIIGSGTQLRVIHHGHYCDYYENKICQEEARENLGISQKDFVYLSLGSLLGYKGHPALIDTFSRISQAGDRLLLVGSPSDSDYVSQLVSLVEDSANRSPGTMQLVPRSIEAEEMQQYFNAADAVVLPFSKVLNSGSLLLAMSFGKPVVAPRIGSIPEIAHPDSYAGYDPKDEEGLAAAMIDIRALAKNPECSPAQIIQWTRDHYSWDTIGSQLKNWYSELVNAS